MESAKNLLHNRVTLKRGAWKNLAPEAKNKHICTRVVFDVGWYTQTRPTRTTTTTTTKIRFRNMYYDMSIYRVCLRVCIVLHRNSLLSFTFLNEVLTSERAMKCARPRPRHVFIHTENTETQQKTRGTQITRLFVWMEAISFLGNCSFKPTQNSTR